MAMKKERKKERKKKERKKEEKKKKERKKEKNVTAGRVGHAGDSPPRGRTPPRVRLFPFSPFHLFPFSPFKSRSVLNADSNPRWSSNPRWTIPCVAYSTGGRIFHNLSHSKRSTAHHHHNFT